MLNIIWFQLLRCEVAACFYFYVSVNEISLFLHTKNRKSAQVSSIIHSS